MTVVPTFGTHAIPPEYRGREDDYVTLVVDEMLPQAAAGTGIDIRRERPGCSPTFL